MNQKHILLRNLASESYLDSFFVSGITAVLFTRWLLHITNYFQLGGSNLHIAHVLWGGFLMLIAIVILTAYINQLSKQIASVVGGLGFGLFIDELGKFITHDNNYFYQPTIAIVYVIFIILYLSIQAIEKYPQVNEEENLANVLENMKHIVTNSFDYHRKHQTLKYLEKCDATNPLVISLKKTLDLASISNPTPSFADQLGQIPKKFYTHVIKTRYFSRIVIVYFTIQSVISLAQSISVIDGNNRLAYSAITSIGILEIVILLVTGVFHFRRHAKAVLIRLLLSIILIFIGITIWKISVHPDVPVLSHIEWGILISSTVAGIFTIVGISRIRISRLFAYKMFRNATLTNIFFTQVMTFYQDQLSALLGLLLNILTLIALRFLMDQSYIPKKSHHLHNHK